MSNYPIVLISGWAMPAGAMASLADALDVDHRRVSIVELPGLVRESQAYKTSHDWHSLLTYLDHQLFEKPAVLVGWSLGGMLAALYASRYPDNVAAVVNLGANACFVQSDSWQQAMDPTLFASFYQGMSQSRDKTLQQFVLLCSSGSPRRKELSKALQALLSDADLDHQAEDSTLLSLLGILGKSDLRSVFGDIRCPVTHLFGKDDALVPVGAADAIEQAFAKHRVQVLDGGHCFFMDDPEPVISEVRRLSSGDVGT
ncbi:alpha/beta fold hydrolase [Endozoicomonas sp. GU-1]|uniref:alpha/beta fold hydrolase n=1 Tax=Endozoicomonas sp. GU-1 TaxID=3009078 RepID=UPI0022B46069|nr:alpha/beta fold hydrolase [Endozoicomonas sp. GU-1]WBA82436.1 alpha/beta fold hydrolase [Endozoicomonas sp. GU-1]WBA85368.1 alpha/beta fold hydrolase [Endozoicomonas sp. GU-1]